MLSVSPFSFTWVISLVQTEELIWDILKLKVIRGLSEIQILSGHLVLLFYLTTLPRHISCKWWS